MQDRGGLGSSGFPGLDVFWVVADKQAVLRFDLHPVAQFEKSIRRGLFLGVFESDDRFDPVGQVVSVEHTDDGLAEGGGKDTHREFFESFERLQDFGVGNRFGVSLPTVGLLIEACEPMSNFIVIDSSGGHHPNRGLAPDLRARFLENDLFVPRLMQSPHRVPGPVIGGGKEAVIEIEKKGGEGHEAEDNREYSSSQTPIGAGPGVHTPGVLVPTPPHEGAGSGTVIPGPMFDWSFTPPAEDFIWRKPLAKRPKTC